MVPVNAQMRSLAVACKPAGFAYHTPLRVEGVMRIILVAAFGVLVASPAAAGFTGNTIYEQCVNRNRGGISAYVAGVWEKASLDLFTAALYVVTKETDPEARKHNFLLPGISNACVPQGVTMGQMADVFCKYLTENPNRRQSGAASLVMKSLENAFPCPSE